MNHVRKADSYFPALVLFLILLFAGPGLVQAVMIHFLPMIQTERIVFVLATHAVALWRGFVGGRPRSTASTYGPSAGGRGVGRPPRVPIRNFLRSPSRKTYS